MTLPMMAPVAPGAAMRARARNYRLELLAYRHAKGDDPLPFKWEVLAAAFKEQWNIPIGNARFVMDYLRNVTEEEGE